MWHYGIKRLLDCFMLSGSVNPEYYPIYLYSEKLKRS